MSDHHYFCLNPNCPNHKAEPNDHSWYKTHGGYETEAFGFVTRFKCSVCGKTFSHQTFSLNYYLKKKTDFKALSRELTSQNSNLFTGRHNKLSSDSIRIRRDRIGRNSLYFQQTMLEDINIKESFCADGFESYVNSKYYPINLNIAVGSESEFLYFFTNSVSKRKGKMTAEQAERVKYEYVNKSFAGCKLKEQFTNLIRETVSRTKKKVIELFTDEHPTYKTIIEEWNSNKGEDDPYIKHTQVSSKLPRSPGTLLFPVNYLDMLFRKDCPMFRRRSICYGKNLQNMMLRVSHYMVMHNFFKPKRITSKREQLEDKHHTLLGFDEEKLSALTDRLYTDRFFLSRVDLPEFFFQVWTKSVPNPLKDEERKDVPEFVYQ